MEHNVLLFVLTMATPFVFAVTVFFNTAGMNMDLGIYKTDTSTLSDKYSLEITPAGWTFSIWGLIYIWQGLWIIYAVVNLCRKTEQGPLYTNPTLLSVPFFVIYIINLGLNVTWLLVFDREYIEAACAVLAGISVTLYILLIISYRALDRNIVTLVKQGRKKDVWLTRMLVQNGLGIYATWVTIATLLNFGFVLAYRSSYDISQRNASTVSLSILGAIILVFLATDWFLLDRYSRYTFTPYIVLIVGITGSVTKNYEEGSRNTIISLALLAIAGFAAVVKCVLIIWRHCRSTKDGVIVTSDGLTV